MAPDDPPRATCRLLVPGRPAGACRATPGRGGRSSQTCRRRHRRPSRRVRPGGIRQLRRVQDWRRLRPHNPDGDFACPGRDRGAARWHEAELGATYPVFKPHPVRPRLSVGRSRPQCAYRSRITASRLRSPSEQHLRQFVGGQQHRLDGPPPPSRRRLQRHPIEGPRCCASPTVDGQLQDRRSERRSSVDDIERAVGYWNTTSIHRTIADPRTAISVSTTAGHGRVQVLR